MTRLLSVVALLLSFAAFAEGEEKPQKPPLDVHKLAFNPASVKQVMMYHLDEIEACFSQSLSDKYGKKASTLSGELLTSFVIDPAGKVQKPSVQYKRAKPAP